MTLKCGFSKVDITPPLGTSLSGYAFERNAESVNDNLYARFLYLEKDNHNICLIETDLIAVDRYLCEKISNKIGVKTYCWATHTHSGAGGCFDDRSMVLRTSASVFGETNHSYYNLVCSRIISGITEAKNNLDNAQIRVSKSLINNVGTNRHSKEYYFNPEILALDIKKSNGKRAILYNYACHPTVLNKFNKAITADFPGFIAETIENHENIELCIFLNGAAGDISTRFTRKESSFKEAKRLGNIISSELLKIIDNNNEYEEVRRLDFIQEDVKLSVREFPSIEDAQGAYNSKLQDLKENKDDSLSRILQSELEGAQENLLYVKNFPKVEKIDTLLSGIVINNHFIIGIPGELFNSLGDDIKVSIPDNVFLGTYFQDYVGYIVPYEEYEKGSYESLSTVLAKGTGEYVVSEVINLIKKLKEKE